MYSQFMSHYLWVAGNSPRGDLREETIENRPRTLDKNRAELVVLVNRDLLNIVRDAMFSSSSIPNWRL